LHPEPATRDLAALFQLLDHRPRAVRRYRKADADRSAIRRINGRVDSDHVTLEIECRTAGIAPVHGCIDLQKIVVGTGVNVAAASGNDAAADRVVEAKRTADGKHPVPYSSGIAVAPAGMRQRARAIDLE